MMLGTMTLFGRLLPVLVVLVLLLNTCMVSTAGGSSTRTSSGDVSALYDLLDRVLGTTPTTGSTGSSSSKSNNKDRPSSHFVLILCTTSEKNTNVCSCSTTTSNSNENGWFCMEQESHHPTIKSAKTNTSTTSTSTSTIQPEPARQGRPSRLVIRGTSVSEISYGIGYYLRYYCNVTLGWDRIGGSVRNVLLAHDGVRDLSDWSWPMVVPMIRKQRRVPWSYLMNVCTHSYSLVWYDWSQWEAFLDWASLMGINNLLALTGQEEIQYKVFLQLGLQDEEIRTWFNGPAFLTWSRGQNEYGNNIAGPLPRSWMKHQWTLQRNHILPRLHDLTMVGQLPAFQGNVPVQLSNLYPNSKMTRMGDTAWLDASDALYAIIADLWMKTLLDDFGGDNPNNMLSHWYQMDGYFNGGVPPWMMVSDSNDDNDINSKSTTESDNDITTTTTTTTRIQRRLPAMTDATKDEPTIATPNDNYNDSFSTTKTKNISHDDLWYQRGVAAYTGLNRTDPDAIWSFQGFSFIGWNESDITARWLKGFVDSAPPGKFVIIDMSYSGLGEWTKWNNASYFGASFIWSALHNFGNTNGLKGDMNRIASILPTILQHQKTTNNNMVGIGATPEGIDQNPVYYEFLLDQAFVSTDDDNADDGDDPVFVIPNVTSFLVERALRRYDKALLQMSHHQQQHHHCHSNKSNVSSAVLVVGHITKAWELLAQSSYATDQSVQDSTGVAHRNPSRASQFESDRHTPTAMLCDVFGAWDHLIQAGMTVFKLKLDDEKKKKMTASLHDHHHHNNNDHLLAPFTYDVINLGREVLAQLSTPMALNFSDALAEVPLNQSTLLQTSTIYVELLTDLDRLLGSHVAFLVGPWIESARAWGTSTSTTMNTNTEDDDDDDDDCPATSLVPDDLIQTCSHFYEWNARVQITTWNPTTTPNASSIPGGPIDYAAKHWNGLIHDYYAKRANIVLEQAWKDAHAGGGGGTLNQTKVSQLEAQHAYQWTTSQSSYPTQAVGDPLALSLSMIQKYRGWFDSCPPQY